MAGQSCLDLAAQGWRAAVLLAYPIIGLVGQAGEVVISLTVAAVVIYTPQRRHYPPCTTRGTE